jgi:hypothetical protein
MPNRVRGASSARAPDRGRELRLVNELFHGVQARLQDQGRVARAMEHASPWQSVLYQIRLHADMYIQKRARMDGDGEGADVKHTQACKWQAQVQKELLQAGKRKQTWVLGELMRYLQDSYTQQVANHGPPGADDDEDERFTNAYDMLVSVLESPNIFRYG